MILNINFIVIGLLLYSAVHVNYGQWLRYFKHLLRKITIMPYSIAHKKQNHFFMVGKNGVRLSMHACIFLQDMQLQNNNEGLVVLKHTSHLQIDCTGNQN